MKGKDAHLRRLKNLHKVDKHVAAVLTVSAQMVESRAKQMITTGAVSGKSHRPSAAGTPPNNDTGHLKGLIEGKLIHPALAEVTSEAEYAAIHEFGGTIQHPGGTPYFMRDGKPVFVSNSGHGAFHGLPVTKPHTIEMPARPYMRPARDECAPKIRKLLVEKLNDVSKRSGSK